jgi:4-hydroxybenzoyl-CoA reductase subunit beta
MKQGIKTPKTLIGLGRIEELKGLKVENGRIRIGAMTKLQDIACSPIIQQYFPVIGEGIRLIGGVQHRYMGSIGGNLCLDTRCLFLNRSQRLRSERLPCHKTGGGACYAVPGSRKCFAVYSGDLAPVLIGLGASLIICDSRGNKNEVALESFFTGDPIRPNILAAGEILAEILIPVASPRFARYYKMRARDSIDFAEVAMAFINKEDGRYRIIANGVGSSPVTFPEIETVLAQEKHTSALISTLAKQAVSKVKTVNNTIWSAGYRRNMVGALFTRAFTEMGVN